MSKTIPPTCPEPESGPKYWRSLDQLAETPEFRQWVEREFPAGASELTDPVSRRHFVKIMSASFMLAGLGLGATGCRRPEEKILPFSKMPEGYVYGVPQFFATAMPVRGSATALVARSNEGRPTKVEGNAGHPDSNGGTDRFAQASVLNLYDPDRAMRFASKGNKVSPAAAFDFLHELSQQAQANGGEGLCFLSERSNSPSRARLQKLISDRFPKARWFVYEPVDFDVQRQAASQVFGKSVTPRFDFENANVVLSLDCDFIGSEENADRSIRGFTKRRKIEKPDDSLNRLYAVEGVMTLTGVNADHRLRMAPSAVIQIAAGVAVEVLAQSSADSGELGAALAKLGLPVGVKPEWVRECAKDLVANKGQSLVVAGYSQPLAVHVIANTLNALLGNIGKTVVYQDAPTAKEGTIAQLADALNRNEVATLVLLGGNPVYNAPADLKWAEAQRKAKTVVRLSYYEDESSDPKLCDWQLPLAHYLESWGDARTADGTLVTVQPLVEPLYGGVTEIEVLGRIAGFEKIGRYVVRETFHEIFGGDNFEEDWKKFLHDGFLAGSAAKPVAVKMDVAQAVQAITSATSAAPAPSKNKLEVVFCRDSRVDDGRYTNNGWLQELPDPITKMVWENVVLLSQNTAVDLGIVFPKNSQYNKVEAPLVKISLGGREVVGPAWIQPGMADNVIALSLGYGRQKCGRVGNNSGYNAYAIRTAAAPYIAGGATLSATGQIHPLSTTQNHGSMEGRPIIREANLSQFRERPDFAKAMSLPEPEKGRMPDGKPTPLYPNPLDIPGPDGKTPRERATHSWGMSVDLNACVGCSSCMMACQSENNIPIVGKDLVGRNREMHWIRIDRYYAGKVEDPQVVNQPMMCQHCESAPCESVCPVNATVHDEEGLNVMAYNRCVGTRYCSNNCPYKVRRFNYLDYNKRPLNLLVGPFYSSPIVHSTDGEWDLKRWWNNPDSGLRPQEEWELLKLVKNPQVTVRMRGIMEKCTFCIQRIEEGKIAQKIKAGASDDVVVPDGVIKTACQQACPAGAIVFGNLKDPDSRVSKLKQQERNYGVLEFLNVKPRTTYLARVRNPNPAMPDYYEQPLSLVEWEAKGNEFESESELGTGHQHEAVGNAEGKGTH